MEVFVAVASLGSFTIAAKELNTSRTALGAMIDSLEETIGERLFHRKRSIGITLTTAGERLLPRALSVLRDAENIVQEVASTNDLVGELVIGATVSLTTTVMPRLLEQLAADHPRLKVRIVVKSATELITMLEVGGIELLLSYITPKSLQNLAGEPLFETQFGLVARRDQILSTESEIKAQSLAGKPIAILDNPISRDKLFDYLEQAQATEININYRVGTLPLCLDIVRRGLAMAIVPIFSLMKEELSSDLVSYNLEPRPSMLQASVSWASDVSLSFAAKAAIENLRRLRFEQNW